MSPPWFSSSIKSHLTHSPPVHRASSLEHEVRILAAMVDYPLGWKMPSKAQTKMEETALHLACAGRHSALAMTLMAHKDANIATREVDGQQAIHHGV